jgi:3-deoxy-D-manno-octulosonic acid kinase
MTVPGRRPPSDYSGCRIRGADVVTHGSATAWAETILDSGQTLHGWAAEQPEREAFAGRGSVYSIPAPEPGPDGRARWAVRHYRRGGAMASHLGDRYLRLGTARPFRELLAATAARALGIATPAVVAAAAYPKGIYYQCDLVTEVVPDATTLAEVLHHTDGTKDWLRAMAAAGRLIGELGEAGVHHVDLNAHNVIFEDRDLERPWVVDLDRARVRTRASEGAKERMRARLTRSVVKVGTPTGERLGEREVLDALRRRGP